MLRKQQESLSNQKFFDVPPGVVRKNIPPLVTKDGLELHRLLKAGHTLQLLFHKLASFLCRPNGDMNKKLENLLELVIKILMGFHAELQW